MTRTLTKKRKLRHNSTDEKGSRKRTFFVAHNKIKSGRKNRSSYSRLFVINTDFRLLSYQKSPDTFPSSSTSILYAAGCFGSPGIVIISPVRATINPAPADRRTSRTVSVKPFGLPSFCGSSDREYCVFATQIGSLSLPSFSISEIAFSAFEVNTTSPAR